MSQISQCQFMYPAFSHNLRKEKCLKSSSRGCDYCKKDVCNSHSGDHLLLINGKYSEEYLCASCYHYREQLS